MMGQGQLIDLAYMLRRDYMTATVSNSSVVVSYNIGSCPFLPNDVTDFVDVFISKTKTPAEYSGKTMIFKSADNNSLEPSGVDVQLRDMHQDNKLVGQAGHYNLSNINLSDAEDKTMTLAFTEKQDYQVNTKLCQNSVMDSCKVLVNGNMSVLQTQFKSSKIKAIEYGLCDENGNELEGGYVSPTDMAGTFEFNSVLTSHPKNIAYNNTDNIGYTWEGCHALTRIPCLFGDESTRLTDSRNTIGGDMERGIRFADQSFNICRSLTYVGPVLNLLGLVPDPQWKMAYSMFNDTPRLSDIRLKNLCNGDWDLSLRDSYRGIPNMDVPSIVYCVDNLAMQASYTWMTKELEVPENAPENGYTTRLKDSNGVLMYRGLLNVKNGFKLGIPEGLSARCVFMIDVQENQWNTIHNEVLEIVGNGETAVYTPLVAGYNCIAIELRKTDGTALTREDMLEYANAGIYLEVASGDGTYAGNNRIPSHRHTVTLPDAYLSELLTYVALTPEIIERARAKGWEVNIGSVEMKPRAFTVSGTQYFALPEMNFSMWVNSIYNTDGFAIDENERVVNATGQPILLSEGLQEVHSTDVISEGATFVIE